MIDSSKSWASVKEIAGARSVKRLGWRTSGSGDLCGLSLDRMGAIMLAFIAVFASCIGVV